MAIFNGINNKLKHGFLLEVANAARMSGGSGVERARRSCSPLDPLVDRSEAEASQRSLDLRDVADPPQPSGVLLAYSSLFFAGRTS